jgi:hypothetical protein
VKQKKRIKAGIGGLEGRLVARKQPYFAAASNGRV